MCPPTTNESGLRLASKGAVLSYGEDDDPHEWSRVVTYQITLECEGESYVVEKRYSQLLSLYEALRSLASRRVEIPHLPRLSRLLVRTNGSIDRIERRRVEIDSWLRRLMQLPKKEQCILVSLLGPANRETGRDDSKVKSVWQGPPCTYHGFISPRWDHLTIRLPWAGELFGCGCFKVVKMFRSRYEDIEKTAGAHSDFVQFCELVQRHESVPTSKEARAFGRYVSSVGRSAPVIDVPTLGDFGVDTRSSMSSQHSQCLDDDIDIQITPASPRPVIPASRKCPDHAFLLPPPSPWDV